jgi:hypothetical protein
MLMSWSSYIPYLFIFVHLRISCARLPKISFLVISLNFIWNCWLSCTVSYGYEYLGGRVSKKVTNGNNTAVMDVTSFLFVSLGSSTVQLHNSLCSRRACKFSEASFNSQNADRTLGIYHRRAAFSCAFFLWGKGLNAKDIDKEKFPVGGGKCLSNKAVHNWIEKCSPGRSKIADCARPGRPVEIATGATVQQVEELIRADRRITIDSVSTAPACSHGLSYSIMHDRLKFRRLCHGGCPEN